MFFNRPQIRFNRCSGIKEETCVPRIQIAAFILKEKTTYESGKMVEKYVIEYVK